MEKYYSLPHYQGLFVQYTILTYIGMNKQKVKEILIEMQKWRRGEVPYDRAGTKMPYTPEEFGKAIDFVINVL